MSFLGFCYVVVSGKGRDGEKNESPSLCPRARARCSSALASVQRSFLRIAGTPRGTQKTLGSHTGLSAIVCRVGFCILNDDSKINRNPRGCVLLLLLPTHLWQYLISQCSTDGTFAQFQRLHCDIYGKGAPCPLRMAELWEAVTIHKGHADAYCKVKWHLICICPAWLFRELLSILKCC